MKLITFLLLFTVLHVFAKGNPEEFKTGMQPITVTGMVTDANGEPLLGVSIQLKGTTKGTTTDLKGEYALSDVPGDAVLVFSFVGMLTREVLVNGLTTIDVMMTEDLIKLDELVVVGYGTRSKRFVSGSISSVDMDETKSLVPNTNAAQSLGQIAGVQFINNGRPGQGGELLIRGQNSLTANTDPLIILDGIIFEGNLSDINPQDIKSIDVLKDAASTAIYGSRAANGVIMITSVTGTSAKPVIRVNATLGISEAGNWMELQSKEGYIQRRRDYHTQANTGIDISDISELLEPEEYENYSNGVFQDGFKDIISRQGSLATLDLSVSGRTDRTNYLISGSMSRDVGLIKGDQEKRTLIRVNLETQITSWLKIGTASFFTFRDMSGKEADIYNAYRNSPFGTFYYPDRSVKFNPVSSEAASYNCMYEYELTDNTETRKNLFSNLYTELDIPFIKGLSFRLNYAPNYEWHNNYSYMRQDPYAASNNTIATKDNENIFRWVWENILTYKWSISAHDFDITLMYGRNHYEKEETNAEAKYFEIDNLGYNNLGLGSDYVIQTPAEEKKGVSSMARLNYMFKKKYILSLAVRRDGSSVFGENNKFATFPSVALSWIVSEEPFLKNAEAVSFLKFRVSYGANGNEAIPPYRTQSLNKTIRNVLGDGSTGDIAFIPLDYMGNESLKWESTYSTNIGVDFGFFDGRVNGSLDVYTKTTKDLLVERDIPPTNGYLTTYDNIGEVNNRGIEVTLNTVNVLKSKFNWNTFMTFAYNKNEIVHLFGDIDGDGKEDDAEASNWFIGENINSYFNYEFTGIYQVDDDIPAPYRAGDIILKDMDGDTAITQADRTIVGHGIHPDFTLTFNNTFRFGNLSLYISVNSMLGWVAPFDLIYPADKGRAFNALDAGYWTPENRSDTRPSLTYSAYVATGNHYYVSRDFLRVKDIALSYDFSRIKAPVLSSFSSLRLSFSVKNLYTFTKWLGPDPENTRDIETDQGGRDLYPMPRIYSLGINMSF
ncbi:MAG: SusC/RagA family TonB-linked outer membrane protein [Bacteroidales bacterium]|nr:SusC/RagA family TonB-linked outer membrane protein [Bacteroidales bacterium]